MKIITDKQLQEVQDTLTDLVEVARSMPGNTWSKEKAQAAIARAENLRLIHNLDMLPELSLSDLRGNHLLRLEAYKSGNVKMSEMVTANSVNPEELEKASATYAATVTDLFAEAFKRQPIEDAISNNLPFLEKVMGAANAARVKLKFITDEPAYGPNAIYAELPFFGRKRLKKELQARGINCYSALAYHLLIQKHGNI